MAGFSIYTYLLMRKGFPRDSVVENPPANAGDLGDAGSIPGTERSPGGGNGNPCWYSCLGNPMDRRAWWDLVHRIINSWTQLKWLSTQSGAAITTIQFSVQFSSVTQSCPTLCDPVNRSMPGLSVHDQLPEFTQEVSNKSPCNEYSLGTSSFMYIVISKLHNNPRR